MESNAACHRRRFTTDEWSQVHGEEETGSIWNSGKETRGGGSRAEAQGRRENEHRIRFTTEVNSNTPEKYGMRMPVNYTPAMRFMLYNVRYCTGQGGHFHFPWSGYLRRTHVNLKQITEFIQAQAPDIIGLLEVDAGSYRSGRKNQAEVIAEALDHYHVYESKYGEPSFAQYLPIMNKQVNAFLSSDVIKSETFHYFEKGVKKLVIELELENLVVFLVHLSLTYRTRHHQLSDLYTLVKDVQKPCIVAGDFNAFWGDHEIKLFLAATGMLNACPEGRPSFPSWNPKRQLDFILHSPEIAMKDFYMPHVTYSDHLPLICDFDIR